MLTISTQEIKRRGLGVVDQLLEREPVHVVKNNDLTYVVLREEDYQIMLEDLSLARIVASEEDVKAGRVKRGSAADLIKELSEGKE